MRIRREYIPVVVLLAGVAVVFSVLTAGGWLVLLTDGLLAGAVIAAAAGWGAWPAVWLGLGQRRVGQQVCVATALGLGILGMVTLVLGVLGVLNRPVAWGLLIVGGMVGLARVYRARGRAADSPRPGQSPAATSGGEVLRSLVLLALAVPVAVALFGAVLPPGVLWADEAKGYDVLEYHLQGPREYFDAGRITFLPHNVYTSFPQQMEMLYLLLMHLAGGPYNAAIAAQLLHVLCGVLAVVALGCWGPGGWGRVVVWVVAGSVPWLAYLGCLAYVECGLLLFGAVAAGLVVDHYREETRCDWRTALAAGLCAGLAGGCKYTALAFVGAGLGIAWLCTLRGGLGRRVRPVGLYAVGALLAFSPWLIRNAAFTGNPVYPFAYEWFGGKAWSVEQAGQWDRGHRLPIGDASVVGRGRVALRELFGLELRDRDDGGLALEAGGTLFGLVLVPLAVVGLLASRSRVALMMKIWGALIFLAWMTLTHMPGRFAVPLIIPLAMLAGRAFDRPEQGAPEDRSAVKSGPRAWLGVAVVVVAVVGATLNARMLWRLLDEHDRFWTEVSEVPLGAWPGRTDWLLESNEINMHVSDPDAYVWLVGRANVFYVGRKLHYTVAFSRDPWVEYARSGAGPAECVRWLRSRNVTHVVFSWAEIERLRRTYGFAEVVTPAWAEELAAAGLARVPADREPSGRLLSEVFEVAPE